ncbi:hypothetical protein [Chryseobacterium sp.]|uniref:hypothetical protein n=1 Tax=Chryseobacterium sp. TaxID=1871047 RepID=UPI0031DDC789
MLKIFRPMELIKDTDLNMTEITYEIGYSHIADFSNNFYQLTNMRDQSQNLGGILSGFIFA